MPNDELEDLKASVALEDGETVDGVDLAPEEEEVEEETVEELKARLKKAEDDRDNYKKGMLSHVAKKRSLDIQEKSDASPETPDISEEKVLSVLFKQNERAVMKLVVDPASPLYLPDLVDDKQFQTIVSEYLPRNIDKSSPEGIHRALRIAAASWRADNGITDKQNTKAASAKLQETATDTQGGGTVEVKKARKRILTNTSASSPKDWYK